MSYILEALKKADQERSRGEVPDIRASHLVRVDGGRYRRLGMVLLVLFLCLQALLLYLYLREDRPTAVAQQALEAPPAPLAAAPEPEPAAPVASPPVRPAPILLEPPAAASAPEPVPAAPTAPVRQAVAEVPELSLHTWQQGSAAVQQLGAELSLDVHVYAEQPAQRFVLINMTRYREGDRLKEGALLERITSQGVVLSYQGELFRYDRP
jgi:general secretion pathway protein B